MRIKQGFKKRLNKARMVGSVVKDSLVFKIKRRALKKRFKLEDVKFIIVDMDGTMFESDASLEALKLLYPEKDTKQKTKGEKIYEKTIKSIADGNKSFEEAVVKGFKHFVDKGFNKKQFKQILKVLIPNFRVELIKSLKEIKDKRNVKIILATLSAANFAEFLNEHLTKKYGFSFDGVVGSKLLFDEKGKAIGIKRIIGTTNKEYNGIRVLTKLEEIKRICKKRKWKFDLDKCLLITDSYGDIDLAKNMKTILIKAQTPSAHQKVSQRLRLADYMFPDDVELGKNLEALILH